MKKLDNRGFTLTELMVVVAILGIFAGTLTASVNQIFANQTREFVNDVDALLSRCRVEMLSGAPSDSTYVELGVDGDEHYYVEFCKGGVSKEKQTLASKNVSVTFIKDGAAEGTPITEEPPLRISFNRSTGAMSSTYGVDGEDNGIVVTVTQIDIAGQKITLVPVTGHHSIGG